jgi:hypothetical protein
MKNKPIKWIWMAARYKGNSMWSAFKIFSTREKARLYCKGYPNGWYNKWEIN